MASANATLEDLLATMGGRVAPPIVIVLGSPRQAADLAASCPAGDVVCYQMDLYQADRLREELGRRECAARVVTAADLWDLPTHGAAPVGVASAAPALFQTAIYPAPHGGERSLKLDMVDQVYHILRPQGAFVILSPYANDQFFPGVLKKSFGRCRIAPDSNGQVLWCQRQGEKPRRRHEITFQARVGDDGPLPFRSRPGVFCYGRLDQGARALVEVMTIQPGERILDLGCGCGTNGVFAGRRSGAEGSVAFVDSNVRGVGLAEYNARTNGLANFRAIASSTPPISPPPDGGDKGGVLDKFDVVLANPPYYAQNTIAQRFIDGARSLLAPGGRLYLVTKQAETVAPLVTAAFSQVEAIPSRDYVVLLGQTT